MVQVVDVDDELEDAAAAGDPGTQAAFRVAD
jgi:hypothetical protein